MNRTHAYRNVQLRTGETALLKEGKRRFRNHPALTTYYKEKPLENEAKGMRGKRINLLSICALSIVLHAQVYAIELTAQNAAGFLSELREAMGSCVQLVATGAESCLTEGFCAVYEQSCDALSPASLDSFFNSHLEQGTLAQTLNSLTDDDRGLVIEQLRGRTNLKVSVSFQPLLHEPTASAAGLRSGATSIGGDGELALMRARAAGARIQFPAADPYCNDTQCTAGGPDASCQAVDTDILPLINFIDDSHSFTLDHRALFAKGVKRMLAIRVKTVEELYDIRVNQTIFPTLIAGLPHINDSQGPFDGLADMFPNSRYTLSATERLCSFALFGKGYSASAATPSGFYWNHYVENLGVFSVLHEQEIRNEDHFTPIGLPLRADNPGGEYLLCFEVCPGCTRMRKKLEAADFLRGVLLRGNYEKWYQQDSISEFGLRTPGHVSGSNSFLMATGRRFRYECDPPHPASPRGKIADVIHTVDKVPFQLIASISGIKNLPGSPYGYCNRWNRRLVLRPTNINRMANVPANFFHKYDSLSGELNTITNIADLDPPGSCPNVWTHHPRTLRAEHFPGIWQSGGEIYHSNASSSDWWSPTFDDRGVGVKLVRLTGSRTGPWVVELIKTSNYKNAVVPGVPYSFTTGRQESVPVFLPPGVDESDNQYSWMGDGSIEFEYRRSGAQLGPCDFSEARVVVHPDPLFANYPDYFMDFTGTGLAPPYHEFKPERLVYPNPIVTPYDASGHPYSGSIVWED